MTELTARPSDEGLLLRELTHRINNEFAAIINTISLAAARSRHREVRVALNEAMEMLHSYAAVHRSLKIPQPGTRVDVARIFVAVADKQHVTQASRELNLTQSATSAAIAALEERYGIKLLDRVGRGIVLTHTGRTFLAEARAVLARARGAEQVLRDIAGLAVGKLVIAASQTVANYWLPPRLQAFQSAYSGIDVCVRIANTERVAADVREGIADIGFVEGDVDDGALSARRIDGDFLVVVVGPRHPYAKRQLPSDWLTQTSWILREPGSGTRAMFELALRKRGFRLSELAVQLELASNEAIRTAVESGVCATAISNLVVEKSIAAKTLFRVEGELAKRSFFVLRHKERHVSKAEAALLASITAAK